MKPSAVSRRTHNTHVFAGFCISYWDDVVDDHGGAFSPVRFGKNNSLQVRTAQDGRFLPVCYSGWDQNLAKETCATLGFRK